MTHDPRIEKLEHECRQLRRALLGMMLMIATVAFLGAAPKPAKKVLQAERLEIVDGDGKVRIHLGPADEGYGLVVRDADGNLGATLTDAPLGAVMSVQKNGGSIKLMALGEGGGITIRDQDGKPRAWVLHQADGPEIMLKDADGKTVFSAP